MRIVNTNLSCIGKTRHPVFASERLGEAALFGKENGRCLLGKLSKVSDQVGLIVVSAINRHGRPRGFIRLNCAEDLLKP